MQIQFDMAQTKLFVGMDEGKTWTYPMGKTWTYREQHCIDQASTGWLRRYGRLYVVFEGNAHPYHVLVNLIDRSALDCCPGLKFLFSASVN